MNNYILYIIAALLFITSIGCEDTIDVTLNEVESELVIDAWIDNSNSPQTITLTKSQPYFEAQFPTGVSGASVTVTRDDGEVFNFIETNDGEYVWTPSPAETLGEVGNTFTLDLTVEGQMYSGQSMINRVPNIDSITYEFREDEIFGPDGIYAELYARDFEGVGDSYYARTYKNGVFLNKPAEMFISYDGTFGAGSGIDGEAFIRPIREFINPIPDESELDDDTPPYVVGDSIHVDLYSISNDGFYYLQLAQEQMLNGDNGIFVIPLANTSGNMTNTSSGETVLGFFNTAAVVSADQVIE